VAEITSSIGNLTPEIACEALRVVSLSFPPDKSAVRRMARVVGNLIGDCVATVVVALRERELNLQLAARVLDGDDVVGARPA
jgi:hypothetical protein